MPEYVPTEKELLELDLRNDDEVVRFLLKFYNKNRVKSEKDLIKDLAECKPIKTSILLQKQRNDQHER